MKAEIKKLNYKKLTITIILIGILLRFALASIYHVAGDACWQLSNSRFIAENLKLPLFEQFGRDEPFWAPPLFHIVSALVYKVFSSFSTEAADFAIKMISPTLGSLTLILFYLLSKKLFDERTALYSVVFLAFVPLHVDYSVFGYVDGMLVFLVVLSAYLALKNKIIGSSITAGLAILTKYNGIFILPVLFYIIHMTSKNRRVFFKKVLVLFLISTLIGSVWFVRNWHYLGNPVWPFMNIVFHGIAVNSFTKTSVGAVKFSNLLDVNAAKSAYLGIFGVPNGNINTLHFFIIPYVNILFAIWLFGTFIFSIPLFIGLISKKLKYRKLLFIWIIAYIVLILLYVINAGWSVSRFLLPSFPAIALLWGHGIANLKPKKFRKIFIVLIALITVGFIVTSFIKISLAAKEWNFYNDDFRWAMENTGKNAIFITESQCISYNIKRQTFTQATGNLEKADYIYVNQNFKLDKLTLMNEQMLKFIESNKYKIAYANNKTGTIIYNVK